MSVVQGPVLNVIATARHLVELIEVEPPEQIGPEIKALADEVRAALRQFDAS